MCENLTNAINNAAIIAQMDLTSGFGNISFE